MSDINKARVRYGQVDREYGLRLATTASDDDGPIWMVNDELPREGRLRRRA